MSDCVVEGPQGRVIEAQAVPYDGTMRHFAQGPADLVQRTTHDRWRLEIDYEAPATSRDQFRAEASALLFDPVRSGNFSAWRTAGMTYTVTPAQTTSGWRFTYLFRGGGDSAQLANVLADPQGWARAGVVIDRVWDGSPHVEVEIVQAIPEYPQAAGLYRWGQGGRPEVLLVRRYLLDEAFGTHLINHEFGHAIVRCRDMIPAAGFPYYSGLMDYSGAEPVPIDREIADARRWLSGQGVVT